MGVLDNTIAAKAGGTFSGIFSNTLIVVGLLIMCGIILGVALAVRYYRQFNITVMIKSKRAGARQGEDYYKIIWDKGAIMKDRQTGTYFFKLFSENVKLPVPPFQVLETSNKGNVLKLLQETNEDYLFLVSDKINKEVVMMSNGQEVPIAELTLKIVEGDIAYWNVLKKRSNKKMFDAESMLMKLLPYVIPVLMFTLVIFLTYMIIKKFDVLAAVAQNLKETAEVLKSMNQADVVTNNLATGGA